MMVRMAAVVASTLLVLIGCDVSSDVDSRAESREQSDQGEYLRPIDLASEREAFATRLLIRGPAPQEYGPVQPPPGVREATYRSSDLDLVAWVRDAQEADGKTPAVVYLHGGWAFDRTDWDDVQPFIAAGYVVVAPVLRGENGNPGEYQAFYGEVDDVVAAGRYASTLPGVDRDRIFLVGHSVGGVLTVLASMMPSDYRAAASLAGYLDMEAWAQDPDRRMVPYDATDAEEIRLRNPMTFSGSLKIPLRLYTESGAMAEINREFARKAQQAGKSCEHRVVPGDHASMKRPAIEQTIEWFGTL